MSEVETSIAAYFARLMLDPEYRAAYRKFCKYERQKELRAERKAKGKCFRCGKNPAPAKASCTKCIKKSRSQLNSYRANVRALGVCYYCKKRRPLEGKSCQRCRTSFNLYFAQWKIKKVGLTPCSRCKRNAARPEKVHCKQCSDYLVVVRKRNRNKSKEVVA